MWKYRISWTERWAPSSLWVRRCFHEKLGMLGNTLKTPKGNTCNTRMEILVTHMWKYFSCLKRKLDAAWTERWAPSSLWSGAAFELLSRAAGGRGSRAKPPTTTTATVETKVNKLLSTKDQLFCTWLFLWVFLQGCSQYLQLACIQWHSWHSARADQWPVW